MLCFILEGEMCNCFERIHIISKASPTLFTINNSTCMQAVLGHIWTQWHDWHVKWTRIKIRTSVFSHISVSMMKSGHFHIEIKVWRMKKVKVKFKVSFGWKCHLNMSMFQLVIFILLLKPRDGIQNKFHFGILMERQIMEIYTHLIINCISFK